MQSHKREKCFAKLEEVIKSSQYAGLSPLSIHLAAFAARDKIFKAGIKFPLIIVALRYSITEDSDNLGSDNQGCTVLHIYHCPLFLEVEIPYQTADFRSTAFSTNLQHPFSFC